MTGDGSGQDAVIAIDDVGADALDALAGIMNRAFDPQYGEAWTPGQTLATFALPGYAIRGLWKSETLIAFAMTRTIAGESELLLFAVDPAQQGQGIGRALVTDWIENSREAGVERLFLEVRSDNPAQHLYSAMGFSWLATRPNYYKGGDGQHRDALTMQRIIGVNPI
jgi:ribosomal-protein-alanine N-acetyltransferase